MSNTILIVDDNAAILTLLGASLTREGYRTESCRDGREAIMTLKKNKNIDLVVSDQIMPDILGSEVALFMRQDAEYKNTPFILISAEQNDAHFGSLIREGTINSYYAKPFDTRRLVNMINILLRQSNKAKVN